MKAAMMFALGCLAWPGAGQGPTALLASFPADSASERNVQSALPEGVSVEFDTARSSDGGGAFRVSYTGAGVASAMLFAVPLMDISDTVLWYRAQLRPEAVTGQAYLELWCEFPGGEQYFSRALPEAVTGTGAWRESRTPFYLAKGQRPARVLLGLRFEGPGTVWLDAVQLTRGGSGKWDWRTPSGGLMGIIGGSIGALVGVWGGIAGFLASRGRARRFVLGSAGGLLAAGVVLLGAGVYLYATGAAYGLWYPVTLFGGLLTLILGINRPIIARRYRAIEVQRLAARDQSESL